MMLKNIHNNMRDRGYTLLFAVLISSLVLSVGLSILNISRKEVQLTSSARESIYAFYAADSGLECAKYHDQTGDKFSTSSPNMNGVLCAGYDPNPQWTATGGTTEPYDFYFELKLPDPSATTPDDIPCVKIFIRKEYVVDSLSSNLIPQTTISSYGYNTGWDTTTNTCSIASQQRVERALRYVY